MACPTRCKGPVGSRSNLVLFQSKLALLNSKANLAWIQHSLKAKELLLFLFCSGACSGPGCLYVILNCIIWTCLQYRTFPTAYISNQELFLVCLHCVFLSGVICCLSQHKNFHHYSAELLSFIWPCLCWLGILDVNLAEWAFVSCCSTFKCKKHLEVFRKAWIKSVAGWYSICPQIHIFNIFCFW